VDSKKMKQTPPVLESPVEYSALKNEVFYRLAREFGITPIDEKPSISFPRGCSGSNGNEKLEFLVAADGSEHLRISTTEKRPYLILAGEAPNAERYRLTLHVPPEARAEFDRIHSTSKIAANPLHARLADKIRTDLHRRALLQEGEAFFHFWLTNPELRYVTAEVCRDYLR